MGKEGDRRRSNFNRTERLQFECDRGGRFVGTPRPSFARSIVGNLGEPFVGHKIVSAEESARIKRLQEVADPLYGLKPRK